MPRASAALLHACSAALATAWPEGPRLFLAPSGAGGGGLVSSGSFSSSYSSQTSWVPDSHGQLHRHVQEVRDQAVSDGLQEKRARAAVACIDGVCEERVKRYAPQAVADEEQPAPVLALGDPSDEGAFAPRTAAGAGDFAFMAPMGPGPLDGARAMMSGMARHFGDMMGEMDRAAARAGAGTLGKVEQMPSGTGAFEGRNSFSRSYSYSNVNGRQQEHVRETRCDGGNCRTVERTSSPEAEAARQAERPSSPKAEAVQQTASKQAPQHEPAKEKPVEQAKPAAQAQELAKK